MNVHAQHVSISLTTMSATPSTTPTSNDFIEAKYRSTTITSIVAAASVVVTLIYLAGLYLLAHRWVRDVTSLNKYSSVRLQRSAPCMLYSFYLVEVLVSDLPPIVVYSLLVLTSIIEVRSPNRSWRDSVSQMKSDFDIRLDTRAVRLQSQLSFRGSQDRDNVHIVRRARFASHRFRANTVQILRLLDDSCRRELPPPIPPSQIIEVTHCLSWRPGDMDLFDVDFMDRGHGVFECSSPICHSIQRMHPCVLWTAKGIIR
jgi:hypothetical protein